MTVYTAPAGQTPPVNSLNDGDTLVLTPSTGNLTVVGNNSPDFAVGGSGTNLLYGGGNGSYLFAGTGNSTLVGGTGSNTIMYGNTGSTSFVGSASGHDIMVGGTGSNSFSMTDGTWPSAAPRRATASPWAPAPR